MSTVKNLNCYLEYDEGVMEIVIIDAVIQMGIHAWGSTLNLSLERDGANLLIKHNAAQHSVEPTFESGRTLPAVANQSESDLPA